MERLLVLFCMLIGTAVYGVWYFVCKRNETKDLPQPPNRSFIWGNLAIAGECSKLFPPGAHVHNWLPYIYAKYAPGDVFYLDWWPLGPRFLFIADPEIISKYITTTQSLPKSPLETAYLDQFLGNKNMVSLEGVQWKNLRAMFNPGFSATHLMTLVPYIVDASLVFHGVLAEMAQTGELFQLEEYATRLTIDIIGKVVLDSDFDSQKATHPIVDTFRHRVGLMRNNSLFPWEDIDLLRPLKSWRNERLLNKLIGLELDRVVSVRAERSKADMSLQKRKKTVVDLALDAYEKETDRPVRPGKLMDPSFRRDVIDSMKTFIFAGHDTTASTIAYALYMLHFHPGERAALMAELDTVFGPGASTASIAAEIKADPYVINKLEYTNAVVKETLRLFPPASTLRYVPKPSDPSKTLYLHDPKTGQRLPISGHHVWPAVSLVSRNESFFPLPTHFVPKRFIQDHTPFPDSKLFTPAGKDAWRPFEKGPRNCIGQELAMIEAKIILALTVRDFDFVAEEGGIASETWEPVSTTEEFSDGRTGKERGTIEGHRCYQVLKGSAKPKGGMPGRLKKR